MQPQKGAEAIPSLEICRRFNASPERVFDSWLSTEWGQWLPPAGATCKVTAIERRASDRYHLNICMPDGRTFEISGTYREVVRPSRLVFTWQGNYSNQETIITLTLTPDGTGTLMTLRQDGFPTIELRDGFDKGWNGKSGSFDKLDAYLARPASAIGVIHA